MLATAGELPVGPGWSYEFKWDGVRALAVVGRTGVHWFARSGAEITKAYPELAGVKEALAAVGLTEAVLDGEIVVWDASGRPSFTALAERMHVSRADPARRLAERLPVTLLAFDLLRLDGRELLDQPLSSRRAMLVDLDNGNVLWRFHPYRTLPIASLTKIMTALLVTERSSPDDQVRITQAALNYQGTGLGVLKRGKRVRLETLLNGLLLV